MDISFGLISQYFSNIELATIVLSSLLFFAASPLCRWLGTEDNLKARVGTMRVLNALIVCAVVINALLLDDKNVWAIRVIKCLVVIYFSVLSTQVINFFVRQRFGKSRIVQNRTLTADTYSSRGLSLIVAAVITLIAVVSCLRILGFNSLLEASGALGLLGFFLAMTQAAWAPDIIAGLIILNSRLCEEGDVIQFSMDGELIVASVFRTKLFHTELLDLANNHRLMVRNDKLRNQGIQNLSRFASAKGLRECLFFNIGYEHSRHEVTEMIARAFEKIDTEDGSREEQYEPEVMVYDTGDYAITWAVYYYIKDVKRMLAIKQSFRAHIWEEARASGISLATPDLHSTTLTNPTNLANKESPVQD